MNKLRLVILILGIGFGSVYSTNKVSGSNYGLFIKASPSPNLERTSLVLENNTPIKLDKETTLSFDMYIREDYMYGIVFRIITNKNENIDLMLTINGEKRHPILVINEQAHNIDQTIIIHEWVPVTITLSKDKDEISLTYGKEKISISYDLSEATNAKVSFGTCNIELFGSRDIASVNIKDVRIFNNGKLTRYWQLKEYLENIVLDSVENVPAIVVNPQWIIGMNSTWKNIYSNKVLFNTQITFDNENKFYIISPDSKKIDVFNTITGSVDALSVADGYIATNSPNMVFFNSASKNLVTYNLSESRFSEYSFETNSWSSSQKPTTDPFLNNSAFYSPSDHAIYSFGGYGYYKYSHDLIKMDFPDGSQKKTELMEIPPRYSASTIIVGHTLYIFGGRGSKSGRQEILPRNYYDFYSVNLSMGQASKLWEDEMDVDFLPGENMVFDQERNCFYLFTSQNGGTLFRLETDKKGLEQVSFSLGEDLEAFYLYTNLYFSKSQQKLYALMYRQITETEVLLTIYELNYPPVPIASLNQIPPSGGKWVGSHAFLIAILIAGVSILGYLIFLFPNKRKIRGVRQLRFRTVRSKAAFEEDGTGEQKYYDFSKSSISLLNGFFVTDKSGNDVSKQFTPTLKYLLLLLILNTDKKGKGIFGSKLIQLLWFDKNEEAAKNNRNVYLSKLRSAFDHVGDVEIINDNGYWSIRLGENIRCDYIEVMHLLTLVKENQVKEQLQVNKLLELLLRGSLLPDIEVEWLDNFKSDFSNLTIDVLTMLSQKYALNDDMRSKIAGILFLHDSINEEALYLRCSVLFNSGKKGIAKSIYNNFCKEYNHLLGTSYKYSLKDVLNRKVVTCTDLS